jgi:hypothetical protein
MVILAFDFGTANRRASFGSCLLVLISFIHIFAQSHDEC